MANHRLQKVYLLQIIHMYFIYSYARPQTRLSFHFRHKFSKPNLKLSKRLYLKIQLCDNIDILLNRYHPFRP